MITLNFAFWLFVFFFAVIGAMRGWAKELLVMFSVILGIFIIIILERYVPFLTARAAGSLDGIPTDFWVRSLLVGGLGFFGYQTPRFSRLDSAKLIREKAQDIVLGFLVGGTNGYLIIGSILAYLAQINYRLYEGFSYIQAPVAGTALGDATLELLKVMPPEWLTIPWIFFAVAIAFAFVVVVFV